MLQAKEYSRLRNLLKEAISYFGWKFRNFTLIQQVIRALCDDIRDCIYSTQEYKENHPIVHKESGSYLAERLFEITNDLVEFFERAVLSNDEFAYDYKSKIFYTRISADMLRYQLQVNEVILFVILC